MCVRLVFTLLFCGGVIAYIHHHNHLIKLNNI
jgi:hypothetical protein